MKFNSKKAMTEALRKQLSTKIGSAVKALMKVYDKQTAAEKMDMHTNTYNKVGFRKFDANVLSRIAEDYKATNTLKPWQLQKVHELIPCYAGQIVKACIANGTIKVLGKGNYEWGK